MANTDANKKLVAQFWQDLYDRDFDKVGAYFAEDGHYTDVPAPGAGAYGPEQIAARLRLGLDMLSAYEHELKHIVADGDVVITEHAETWHWKTGESVTLPFVSVHEIGPDGKFTRWHDYWDFNTLMNAAPAWWLEHIAKGFTA
ncbi:nuclear transport factor 2 family protein [Yinghuangia aomiensis]|uniref:Nuclear transport factor 2 family protein n=1 Tax=Yinghuangia aomiensis TaxID=676205 RepID=A0ABP9GTZ9_9ACTN